MKHRCTHACNGLNKKPKKREGRCIKVGIITTTLLTPLSATTRARANYILCRVIVHRGGRERAEASETGEKKNKRKKANTLHPKASPRFARVYHKRSKQTINLHPGPSRRGL